jgi:hypothetical protein
VRAASVMLLVGLALLAGACGDDGGVGPVAGASPDREQLDAAALFVALPQGHKYGPPPAGERERISKQFLATGIADVGVRQIRRDDGAAGIAVTLVDEQDIPFEDLRSGIEAGGGEVVEEEIDGVPFLVGTDKFDNFIAVRTAGNEGLFVYAATRRDARSFARPFARRLGG